MSEKDMRLALAHGAIGDHLTEIATLFVEGSKLTLVVRQPSHPDGSRDLIVTNDTLSDVVAALQVRIEPAAVPSTGEDGR